MCQKETSHQRTPYLVIFPCEVQCQLQQNQKLCQNVLNRVFCFYSVNGLIFEPCQIGDFCTWLFFSHPTSSYGNFFKYSKFSVVFFFSRLSNFHHVTKKSYILHCNTFFTWTTKKNNQLIKINIYLLSEEEEQCCLFAIQIDLFLYLSSLRFVILVNLHCIASLEFLQAFQCLLVCGDIVE